MLRMGSRFARDNVIGLLALFVALGGTTYAATRGSAASNRTLRACVSGDGSLRLVKAGKRCAKGQRAVVWNVTGPIGPKGPSGPRGADGTNGINGTNGTNGVSKVVVRSTTVTAGGLYTGSVQCDTGERATGGGVGRGFNQPTTSTDRMSRSYPLDAAGNEVTGGETPTGWSVWGDSSGLGGTMTIYVVCVSP